MIEQGKYKKSYKNNKSKIPAPIWNEEFELPDGLKQDYLIKIGYYLKLLTHKTMELLGST